MTDAHGIPQLRNPDDRFAVAEERVVGLTAIASFKKSRARGDSAHVMCKFCGVAFTRMSSNHRTWAVTTVTYWKWRKRSESNLLRGGAV